MAYNQQIADRVERLLYDLEIAFEPKKMFGGIAFMINDKMCVAVVKDELMLRVMDEFYEETVKLPFARPMDFTGKRMFGFLYVEEGGFEKDQDLKTWVERGVDFGLRGIVKTKKKK
ncbi:MAG: TfoX/Sxy family protein [Chitinophagaceae bacterium]